MNLSELKTLVEPYVARGDQFADDFHRLLTTIETDLGLGGPAKEPAAAPAEVDPTAANQAAAVERNRAAVQGGQFSQTTGPAPETTEPEPASETTEGGGVQTTTTTETTPIPGPGGTEPAPAAPSE